MKYSTLILICAAVLAQACGKKPETTKPSVGEMTESVYASGHVKADEQYNVYSLVNGILLHTMVEAGDTVHKGDTLFVLENVTSQLNSENALAVLSLTRENSGSGSDKLRELELAVELSHDKYLLDSSLFVRQKKLWDQGVGSRLEFEQREFAFQNSKSVWLSSGSRLAQIKSQLNNELRRAQISYDISRKSANDFVIRSNIAGKVFSVLKEDNELVTPQTPMAVIGKPDSFTMEMQIDEYDIVKIAMGQKVLVTMDSYKGEVFEGEVTRIDPIMNERSRSFTIEAKFTKPPGILYPNLTLEANIILETRPSSLTIPRRYLSEGKYVYISKSEKKEVKTGLMDYQKVEILEGLDSAEEIFLPPVK